MDGLTRRGKQSETDVFVWYFMAASFQHNGLDWQDMSSGVESTATREVATSLLQY